MLEYAGEKLLTDADDDLQGSEPVAKLLRATLGLEDLRLFGVEPVSRYLQSGSHMVYCNYTDPPDWKLNTVYWPTGASRWTRCLVLAETARKDRLLEATNEGEDYKLLVMGQEYSPRVKQSMAWRMRMLPPRPVHSRLMDGTDAVGGLWLIPLVDIRYFWQWISVQKISAQSFTSVASVVSFLETTLGATIDDSDVPGTMKAPTIDISANNYLNAAVVLDSLCESIGCRLVQDDIDPKAIRDPGANFTMQPYDMASSTFDTNEGRIRAHYGDTFQDSAEPSRYPEKIIVLFPFEDDTAGSTHEHQASEFDIDDVVAGTHKTHWCTTEAGTAGTDQMAQAVAEQMFASRDRQYNLTGTGLAKWTQCAFDDWITYQYRIVPSQGVSIQMRASSLPEDFACQLATGAGAQVSPTGTIGSLGICDCDCIETGIDACDAIEGNVAAEWELPWTVLVHDVDCRWTDEDVGGVQCGDFWYVSTLDASLVPPAITIVEHDSDPSA